MPVRRPREVKEYSFKDKQSSLADSRSLQLGQGPPATDFDKPMVIDMGSFEEVLLKDPIADQMEDEKQQRR